MSTTMPETEAELVTKIEELQARIDLYITNPAEFAVLNAGSVSVSMPEFVKMLREERDRFQERLDNFPDYVDSDVHVDAQFSGSMWP